MSTPGPFLIDNLSVLAENVVQVQGLTGDGVADESDAINAALVAHGQIHLAPGTYQVRNIQLTGERRIIAPGATFKNDFGEGDPLFIVDGSWTHGLVQLRFIDNGADSGPVFDIITGGIHHSVIDVQQVLQRAPQPILTNINRTGDVSVYFSRFKGARWRGPQSNDRSGKMFHWTGGGNRFNANEIDIMRYDCNEDYFFYFDVTSGTAAFNTGNVIKPASVEIAGHGFIWLGGCRNWDIQGLYHYDAPELQAHFVRIGAATSGDASSGIRIAGATRFGGSLAAGIHDIAIAGTSVNQITLERVGNVTASGTPFSVDCGSREVNFIAPLDGLTITDHVLGSSVGAKHIRAPRLSMRQTTVTASRSIIASGVIALPVNGFTFVDTESSAASDDLDTVTATGLVGGEILILRSFISSRDVVLKHNTGNLWLKGAADRTLGLLTDIALFVYDAGNVKWIEL